MKEYEKYFEGKTILITGGCGFIGSNLAITLSVLNPKKIILIDVLTEGLGGNLQNLDEIKNKKNIEIYSGSEWDIKNTEKIKPMIKEAEIIFNLSGSVKHTKFDKKELEFEMDVNFISQVFFLDACRQVMIENPQKKLKIIFSGTRDQYGKVLFNDLPVKEDYLPKNLTDYQSISKNAVEAHHILLNHLLRESGIDVRINSLRLTNTYGPRQSPKMMSVVPVFIDKSIKGETIELWGGGEVLRDLNYVDDVIDSFLLLASSETHGEIFNLGCCIGKQGMENPIGGNLITIKKLAEKIVKITGKGNIRIIPYPEERKAVEPGHFAADISKISEIGWLPKISLEEGLKKTIEWHIQNQSVY
ncbi:MAG: NAD-dependent epimerase/dehydratase family protein [Nanoarchaeota archaeon]